MLYGKLKWERDLDKDYNPKSAYDPGEKNRHRADQNHGLEAEDRALGYTKYKNRKYSQTPSDFDGVATVPFSVKDQFKDLVGKGNYMWDDMKKTWRVKSIGRDTYSHLSRLGVKFS